MRAAGTLVLFLLAACVELDDIGESRHAVIEAGSAVGAESAVEPPALLKSGLPITTSKHKSPRVIYSVPLGQYRSGETLLARGELSVSRCAGSDLKSGGGAGAGNKGSPCEKMNQVTPYDPEVSVRLILAGAATATSGVPLTKWVNKVCSSKRHHCAIPIAGALAPGMAPDAETVWVNLVAGASGNGKNPGAGDLVELEGDCANEDYSQCDPILDDATQPSKGKLDVVRLGPGRSPAADVPVLNRARIEPTMPVRSAAYDKAHTLPDGTIDYKRTRVYEQPIAVRPGQIVEVRGEMHTHAPGSLTGRAYLGSVVLLVEDAARHAQTPGFRTGASDQFVTGHNGFNCRAGKDCVSTKVGSVVVPPGAPATMTVVYVAHAVYAREQNPNAVVKIQTCKASWKTCGLGVTVRDPVAAGAAGAGVKSGGVCGDGACDGDEDDQTCAADCGCEAAACGDVAPIGCYCDADCAASGDCCADAAICQ